MEGEVLAKRDHVPKNQRNPNITVSPSLQIHRPAVQGLSPHNNVRHPLLACKNHAVSADRISPATMYMGIWHKLWAKKNTQCQQEWELCPLFFPESILQMEEPYLPPSLRPQGRCRTTSAAPTSPWYQEYLSQAGQGMHWKEIHSIRAKVKTYYCKTEAYVLQRSRSDRYS